MNFDLYHQARKADEAFQLQLLRVYLDEACEARYYCGKHKDSCVEKAKQHKLAADRAWLDEMQNPREIK